MGGQQSVGNLWAGKLRRAATLLVMLLCCFGTLALAQTTTASLDGIASDPSGARIAQAKVLLVSDTGAKRETVTNKDGIFTFSAVPTGTYTVTVRHTGFESYTVNNITLHPGDAQTVRDIVLPVGQSDVSITVTAQEQAVDSGERDAIISAEDIKHLAIAGRDVTELVKTLPGFAIAAGVDATGNGVSNRGPDNTNVTVGGSLGSYAANGAPVEGISVTSDGANVTDPASNQAQTQTINADMVEEVKVSTSNFGADQAKGPITVNAVGKSGGTVFHGSIYVYGRTYQLNSQDSLNNALFLPKPQDRYIYPGANIGGPVRIPGTDFNHNKKLTFFVGAEDYVQRNTFQGGSATSAVHLYTVPSGYMRGLNGKAADYSVESLANFLNVSPSLLTTGSGNQCTTTGTLRNFVNVCQEAQGYLTDGSTFIGNTTSANFYPTLGGGQIPNAFLDPATGIYLNQILPLPNRTPLPVPGTTQPTDGFNRVDTYLANNDMYQVRGRLDYAISGSSKLVGIYNTQRGLTYQNPGAVPSPTLTESGTNSNTASFNFTQIFGASRTNELLGAGTYYNNPLTPKNPAGLLASSYNYPYGPAIGGSSLQIPQLGYSSTYTIPQFMPPDFSTGKLYYKKVAYNIGDNFTQVWKSHTFKFGVYGERISNNQRIPEATQGALAEYGLYNGLTVAKNPPTNPPSTVTVQTFNEDANFAIGLLDSYTFVPTNPGTNLYYLLLDSYATDSWKATKKLTLTYGVRITHMGPWEDPHHVGIAVWTSPTNKTIQASCSSATAVSTCHFPGVTWTSLAGDPGTPNSGTTARWGFISPRVGFAYDVYGDGKTVFRGGWGAYRSHDAYNDYATALFTSEGAFQYASQGVGTLRQYTTSCATTAGCVPIAYGNNSVTGQPSITALDPHDDEQPLTYTYSATVSQQMPKGIFMELAWSGSSSNDLLTQGSLQNINIMPRGALFGADPNPNSTYYGRVVPPNNVQQLADFRPYTNFTQINVPRHVLRSNYNGLLLTLNKRTGHVLFGTNLTWSKALGYRGGSGTGNAPDPTDFRNDYGILPYDRTFIFNAHYTFIVGKPIHNRYVGSVVNGWEISGITNLQSGPNLQAVFSNNWNLNGSIQDTDCQNTVSSNTAANCTSYNHTQPSYAVNNKTWLGTTDILLQPNITCNPATHVKARQYVNPACFTLPALGVQGTYQYPYARGPAYFASDLTAQKSFALRDKRSFQLRFAAFNFLNHPLQSLYAGSGTPLNLYISGVTVESATAADNFGLSQYKEGRRVTEISLRYNF